MKRYNQVLDVSRDELEDILHMAEMNAVERRMSDLRCRDIMTRDVMTVEYGTDLQDAWAPHAQDARQGAAGRRPPAAHHRHRLAG